MLCGCSGRSGCRALQQRMRRDIAEQAPSSGGNLPSDRHLTRHFYSCSRESHENRDFFPCKRCVHHTGCYGKIQAKTGKKIFFVILSKYSHANVVLFTTKTKGSETQGNEMAVLCGLHEIMVDNTACFPV